MKFNKTYNRQEFMEFNKAYNRQEFMNFLQNSFLPNDFVPTEEQVAFSTQTKHSTEAVKLGTSPTLDLVVYEIKHTSKNDARVALSKEAFRMLADEMEDRALVIFVPNDNNDNYRFSFIEISLEIKEGTSRVVQNYSNPRRYSYLLGKDIAFYTPNKYLNEKGRVVNDEDLRSRFSVEVLTKEFYNELSDWYAWAIKIIRFPNNINDDSDDNKYNNEGAIRLITRLIFVWFLKQRHLVPNEFFDENYIADNLLKDFDPHKTEGLFEHKSLEGKYYKAILQNLFFAMLNNPITAEGSTELSERHFRRLNEKGEADSADYDNNKLMRYEDYFINPRLFIDLANQTVPFLNGGLFDCLDNKDKKMYYDGFSDNKKSRKSLSIPDFLFFGDGTNRTVDLSEWYGDKKKKKVPARGIIDILRRYNFTIEENTPFDKEVSLDPELLGKVFENLLASFNPETQTTARKQTGSFYTPREIVQYMVDESLIAHLKRTVGEELEPQYRQLMQYSDDAVELTSEQQKQIMQSLYACKILDPACGSGAFPMGILQQMVHILGRIDPENKQWKELMMNLAIDETTEAFKNASSEERSEQIKDIERSFDEGVNRPDYARKLYLIENCIYGVDIQPIAIQISKLRFFISLIVDQKTNNSPADNFGVRPLPNLEAKFVAANTLIGLESELSLADNAEVIVSLKKQLRTANHKIFSAKTVKTKRKYKQQVVELRQAIATNLHEMGFIDNSETEQLASWDMFDQNASSYFFDPEWMFGVKGGFDIVIGNPPYVQLQANRSLLAKLYVNQGYKSFFKTGDLYCLFFEKGQLLLARDGVLSYINPNTWLQSITFGPIRSFLTTHLQCFQILLTDKVFDATVDTHCIFFRNRNVPIACNVYRLIKDKSIALLHSLSEDTLWHKSSPINIEANPSELNIINKIKTTSVPLCELFSVFNGVKPFEKGKGKPAQTAITMKEKPFVKEGSQPGEEWLPLMRGSLMNRYVNKWNNDYWILYGEWLAAPRKPEIFHSPLKIIIRQTGDSIVAHVIGSGIVCRNNLHICIPIIQTCNPLFHLGILNSKLINFVYKYINPEKGEVLAEVKKAHVEQLPMANATEAQQRVIVNLVERIIYSKQVDENADTSFEENEIDRIVYNLYGLSYYEIKIVDPQTPITKEEYNN